MVARRLSTETPSRAALIPLFFAGKSVFITGATGFMGKVLVERLLATCPDIGRLFLLMREKKDVPPEKRLLQLKSSEVFDVIRETNPSQLDKLVLVPGDVELPDLGMSAATIESLNGVRIVFHSAATLKFDEALGKAVDQNVRSVITLMDICDRLPNIQAFVHVSTAYSNADLDEVEERVYPAPVDLEQLLTLADTVPADLLAEITPKYIAPKPNTYCFTKAMAETAVERHGCKNYPVAIFRPTIVISSHQNPFPGWIENLNGPSGVVVGAGKGLLHVFTCKDKFHADLLPVDIAIDTLIAVAWETAVDQRSEVRVYNCSTSENPTRWCDFIYSLRRAVWKYPMDRALWYPCGATFQNMYAMKAHELLLQTVPLHLAEYAARLFGFRPQLSLITVSHRLKMMNEVLTFFTLHEWKFGTERFRLLRNRLTPADAALYNLDPNTIHWDSHYETFVKGTRKYLLKEKDQDIEKAQKHLKRMFYLHTAVKLLVCTMFLRLVLHNQFARSFLYGTLRLLLSLFGTVYSRIRQHL